MPVCILTLVPTYDPKHRRVGITSVTIESLNALRLLQGFHEGLPIFTRHTVRDIHDCQSARGALFDVTPLPKSLVPQRRIKLARGHVLKSGQKHSQARQGSSRQTVVPAVEAISGKAADFVGGPRRHRVADVERPMGAAATLPCFRSPDLLRAT